MVCTQYLAAEQVIIPEKIRVYRDIKQPRTCLLAYANHYPHLMLTIPVYSAYEEAVFRDAAHPLRPKNAFEVDLWELYERGTITFAELEQHILVNRRQQA